MLKPVKVKVMPGSRVTFWRVCCIGCIECDIDLNVCRCIGRRCGSVDTAPRLAVTKAASMSVVGCLMCGVDVFNVMLCLL